MIGLLRSMLDQGHYLHMRLNLSAEFRIELWECPGAWLNEDDLTQMVDDLRAVAAASQPDMPIPEYGPLRRDRGEQALRVVTMIYERSSNRAVAFNALRYLDLTVGGTPERVVHLGLTYIDPEYRKQRFSHLLYGLANFLLFFKSGFRRFWVSNVTQVPAVVGLVANHYDHAYPCPFGKHRQTFMHQQLARAIMGAHRAAFGVGDEAGFDATRQIITNAYTGGSDNLKKTFEEAPKYNDERVNAFCKSALDYGRGDDVLQLATWGPSTTLRFFRSKIPRSAWAQLAFRACALVGLALLLPPIRWLTETEPASARGGS